MFRYGPPKQVVLVARLALWLSIWLSENEFTSVEKDHRLSILSWPQWYFGVRSTQRKIQFHRYPFRFYRCMLDI